MMTNKFLLLLSTYLFVIVLIFIDCSSSFSQTVQITGNSEISEGKVIISFLTKNGSQLDSTHLRNGVFEKIIPKSINEKYNIRYDKNESSYDFYSSEHVTHLYLATNIPDSKVKNPSYAQLDHIRYNELFLDLRKEIALTNQQLSHFQKTKVYTDSIIHLANKMDSLENLRITAALAYYKKHPFSLAALESLEILIKRKYGRERYKEFKPLFNSNNKILNSNTNYKSIKQFITILDDYHIQNSVKNYTAPDINSDIIHVYQLAKDKILLIDFWASWCIPCREEHPQLLALREKYKDKFEVLSISIDEDLVKWKKAISEDKIGVWKHLSYKSGNLQNIRRELLVFSVPLRLLINEKGEILNRWEGSDELFIKEIEQKIQKLIEI
nr:TlpA disulfide reductase family protein [uncultured Sphingobacterium sp.]